MPFFELNLTNKKSCGFSKKSLDLFNILYYNEKALWQK